MYKKIVNADIDINKIEKSIKLVSRFPDYEFRTTIAPVEKNEKFDFIRAEEIVNLAKWLVELTGKNEHKYFLQPFIQPEELIDIRIEKFSRTSQELLGEIKEEAMKYLINIEIR